MSAVLGTTKKGGVEVSKLSKINTSCDISKHKLTLELWYSGCGAAMTSCLNGLTAACTL
jgi:hypothetical protein